MNCSDFKVFERNQIKYLPKSCFAELLYVIIASYFLRPYKCIDYRDILAVIHR
jgi:hypothetical protein